MKKHRLPAAVLALAALGFTLGTCEFVIVGILPDIAAGLNVSLAAVGRLVSVFAACYAVGTPLLTALTGRMDRFRLLMGLMLLFLGVNVLSMLAPGVAVLYASRVVAALVSGTLTAVAMLYAKEVSSRNRRPGPFPPCTRAFPWRRWRGCPSVQRCATLLAGGPPLA